MAYKLKHRVDIGYPETNRILKSPLPPLHSPSHWLVTLISPGLAAAAAVVANCGSIFLLFRLGFYSFSIFSRISRLITNNICMVIFN